MRPNRDLDFEESVLDSYAQDLSCIELPLSRKAFVVVLLFGLFLGGVVVVRLIFLNLVSGGAYQIRSEANVNREVIIPAYRGIITDRFGETLVENTPAFSVFINLADFMQNGENLVAKLEKLSEILNLASDEINLRIEAGAASNLNLIPIARNISPDQIIALEGTNLIGVTIEDDYSRRYKNGPVFAHIVGYRGDEVGVGIETVYNDILKGKDGVSVIFEDVYDKEIDKKILSDPVSGSQIVLTIDAGLQRFFYDRLSHAIQMLGSKGGVGIALNPQNGEILALVSLPSFDNNLFVTPGKSQERVGLLNDASQPLFNRAVSGVYNPGSTIKPLVALAALREKLIDPQVEIFSRGYLEVPNPYFPDQPSRFADWKPNGWVDLHSALARSSNIYFYAIGGGLPQSELALLRGAVSLRGLGIEKLRSYWQKFRLDQKTGIDLPAENSGFLPEPEEKERRTGQIWRLGDTYNVSIGQGDLSVTPLGLLNLIGFIATGGKIYQPHLVKDAPPRILLDYSDWAEEINEVKIGLADGVAQWYGTANLLSSLPMAVSGKTGSAQIQSNTKTNAFFVGYLPAEALVKMGVPVDKQIAILVLVENAREGSLNAVPIAKDVFEWYYYNRLVKSSSSL